MICLNINPRRLLRFPPVFTAVPAVFGSGQDEGDKTVKFDIDYIKKIYGSYYDKYYAVRKLAKEYGVKPADIFQILQDNGIIGGGVKKKSGKETAYTQSEIDMLVSMRSSGASFGEIEKILGRSAKTLSAKYQKLRREGKIPESTDPEPVEKIEEKDEPIQSNLILDGAEIKPVEDEKTKPKFTVVDRIPTGYILELQAEFRFNTLEEIRDFFHSDPMLSALVDNYSVTEESTVVIEGDFI